MKILGNVGLTTLWQLIKSKYKNCITRIFWDSSSEIFMYDTMERSDNDPPIQAVNGSGTKLGLITPRDKRTVKIVHDKCFMTNCSFSTNSPLYTNTLHLLVTTVPKNAGASEN